MSYEKFNCRCGGVFENLYVACPRCEDTERNWPLSACLDSVFEDAEAELARLRRECELGRDVIQLVKQPRVYRTSAIDNAIAAYEAHVREEKKT